MRNPGQDRSLFYRRLIAHLAIAAAALIVLLNLTIAGASSSLFCSACHGKENADLKRSKHLGIRCNSCHQGFGTFKVLTWRAQVVSQVAKSLVPSSPPVPVIAYVSSEPCKRCHPEVLDEIVRRDGIGVSHKEIDEAEMPCVQCHARVAHRSTSSFGRSTTMERCIACHDGKKASADCNICHVGRADKKLRVKTSWSVTHGPNWKRVHGMGNLATCGVCHAGDYCKRCHNTSLPHPEFWVRLHPADAKKDVKGCYDCHHRSFCDNCHGLRMPHPSGFLREHAKEVEKRGRGACYRCHLESGCERCHSRHIHPGLDQARVKALRGRSGLE